MYIYAVNWQTPPTSLIFFSALREKNFARTMTGWCGRYPLPRTLKKPYRVSTPPEDSRRTQLTAFVTSMTGTGPSLFFAAESLCCSDTKVQILSMLMVGLWYWFFFKWKCRIPTFPKYPGWLARALVTLNVMLDLTIDQSWSCDGVDHQQDRDLRDVCGAFRYARGRHWRARASCGSSLAWRSTTCQWT